MMDSNIRIDADTQSKLAVISGIEQIPFDQVVAFLANRYLDERERERLEREERERFRREVYESFRALREDPAAWEEYRKEAELWDQTSGDDLENEPPFYDDEA